jgi:hypothetical protein
LREPRFGLRTNAAMADMSSHGIRPSISSMRCS